MILQTAERTLLAPFDLEPRSLERVFGTLAARKVDYADLYFQYSRYEGWSLEEGIVKSGSFNIEQGVGVRALSGEKTAFAASCSACPSRCTATSIRSPRCRLNRRSSCCSGSSANAVRSTRASRR